MVMAGSSVCGSAALPITSMSFGTAASASGALRASVAAISVVRSDVFMAVLQV
jgi:hypothetical protein